MWAVEGAEKQQGMGTMVGDDILVGDISNLSDLIPCSPSSSESLFDFRLFRWRWFVILFGVSFHFSVLLIYQGWAKREFAVDWSLKLFYAPLQDFPPKIATSKHRYHLWPCLWQRQLHNLGLNRIMPCPLQQSTVLMGSRQMYWNVYRADSM